MDNIGEMDFISQTIAQVDEYLRGEREHERQALQRDPAYLAWLDEMDEQDARYWSEHCAQHGTELMRDGYCPLCVQEELREDA